MTKLKQADSKKDGTPASKLYSIDSDLNTIWGPSLRNVPVRKTKAQRRESPESRMFEDFRPANFSTCASLSAINYQKRASTNVAC